MNKHTIYAYQKGVGLIEILISLLVLAIGILAVISLQANALKSNQSSLERTQAVILSYAMLDALRINRSAALAGTYDMSKTCDAPSGDSLVKKDQQFWINSLKTGLGDVDTTCGEIDCDNTGLCVVRVYWNDERGKGGSSDQLIETRTKL